MGSTDCPGALSLLCLLLPTETMPCLPLPSPLKVQGGLIQKPRGGVRRVEYVGDAGVQSFLEKEEGSLLGGSGKQRRQRQKEKSLYLHCPGTSHNPCDLFHPNSLKSLIHPTLSATIIELNFEFILLFLWDGSQACSDKA